MFLLQTTILRNPSELGILVFNLIARKVQRFIATLSSLLLCIISLSLVSSLSTTIAFGFSPLSHLPSPSLSSMSSVYTELQAGNLTRYFLQSLTCTKPFHLAWSEQRRCHKSHPGSDSETNERFLFFLCSVSSDIPQYNWIRWPSDNPVPDIFQIGMFKVIIEWTVCLWKAFSRSRATLTDSAVLFVFVTFVLFLFGTVSQWVYLGVTGYFQI